MSRSVAAFAVLATLVSAGVVLSGENAWTDLGPDAPLTAAVTVDPFASNIIYAGLASLQDRGALFKSTDAGATWTGASEGLPVARAVTAVVAHPGAPGVLYAAVLGAGLFRSIDGAATWSQIGDGLTDTNFEALRLAASDGNVLFVATPSGLFASSDAGATFTLRNGSLALTAIAIDPNDADILLLGTNNQGAFRSVDGGETFSAIDASLDAQSITDIRFAHQSSEIVYVAAGFDAVYRTANGGAIWTRKIFPRRRFATALAIDPVNPSVVYVGAVAGSFFSSTDGGDNWSDTQADLSQATIRDLAIDPAAPSFLYLASDAGLSKSTDGGADWARTNDGLRFARLQRVVVDPADTSRLYALSQVSSMHRSDDDGASWRPFPTDAFTGVKDLDFDPTDPDIVYQSARRLV